MREEVLELVKEIPFFFFQESTVTVTLKNLYLNFSKDNLLCSTSSEFIAFCNFSVKSYINN